MSATRTRVPLVLIVDDVEDLRVTLADLLAMHGFSTVTAGNGMEALSIFGTRRPDAAIIDVGMPGMGGFELAARFRAREPDLPIMAYSGFSGKEFERQARAAGCSGVLVKSMDPRALVATVEAALHHASAP